MHRPRPRPFTLHCLPSRIREGPIRQHSPAFPRVFITLHFTLYTLHFALPIKTPRPIHIGRGLNALVVRLLCVLEPDRDLRREHAEVISECPAVGDRAMAVEVAD